MGEGRWVPGRRYWHCRDAATDCAAASEAHWTMSVPPWFSALQVPLQVTVQVAPDWHVTVEPAPAVTVQSLPASQVTLAEAPDVSLQVAWL
jgi:hypothetical protein